MSDIDQIINENAQARTLSPQAVGTQVALMSVISIVTILAFNVLRPKNKIIYEPKVKYHIGEKTPPRISDSLLGWLPPLVRTKEPELVEKIGVDAVTFLRFLRMFRWCFFCIAFLTCAVLVPINVSYNLKNISAADRTILSMLTIRDVHGSLLYVHVAMTYVITGVAMAFVWVHWGHMVRLRHDWFRSPEYLQSFHARTLAITKVPKKWQSDEGIVALFQSVQVPYPTTSVHIGRKVGKLPELIDYHNKTVRELEQVLVRYLKGGSIAKERPTIRIGGFMGCGGVKKDAIDFYTAKLKRTEGAIEEYRNQYDTHKAENYGFASMAAVPYAHVVAALLRKKHPKGADVQLAPHPKDIIWANLSMGDGARYRKRMLGFIFLAVVCFFNTIPLFIISVLANLGPLAAYVPFLQSWANASPSSFAFVSGVLPPAVSALFGFFLPIIIRWLSDYMGNITHSRLDRAVIARYFAFLVISQLVIFTLIGVVFISVQQIVLEIGQHKSFNDIINNLHNLPSTINQTYIDQSSYWLTFFPLRGFLVLFDLAQILNLVWTSFKTHVFGRTPRDIREWTQPPEFQYAVYYSNMLFMGTVALVFAPLAPLVVVAAAVVFWLSSWVYKYQLMFVYVSKVETGGRLWNLVINRFLFSVMLMQALMILTIGLQYKFKSLTWLSTLPPIIFVLIFKRVIDRKFDRHFRYFIPTEDEIRVAKVHSQRADNKGNRLEKRFGHPALHADLFTPMLHAKMMPLLADVYKGKINSDRAKLDEYGGQKMEAQIVPGGVRIAAISQSDLAYDVAQYQREWSDLDWDQRSIASTNILGSDTASLHGSKSNYYAGGRASPAPAVPQVPFYDRYMQQGAGIPQSEIELSRFDTGTDQQPLLNNEDYFNMPPPPRPPRHYQSGSGSSMGTPPQYASPPISYRPPQEGYREAPVHRPYPPSRQASSYTDDGAGNIAGRGSYRAY